MHSKVYYIMLKATKKPRQMNAQGRSIDMGVISKGDTFFTLTQRVTTPYPKQKSLKYSSLWLIENAALEAASRQDKLSEAIFRGTVLLKDGSLSCADRESMLIYLFEYQPEVKSSILKPVHEQHSMHY